MDKTKWQGALQLVIGLALAYLFFYMMKPFLVAILLGAIIAIIAFPLYTALCKKIPRILSAVFVTVGIVIGVMLPLFLVLYNGADRLLQWLKSIKLPDEAQAAETLVHQPWLRKTLNAVQTFVPVDREWLHDQAVKSAGVGLTKLSGFIGDSLKGMPGFLLGFTIVMISIYFFLVDGDRFLRFLSSLSPMKFEKSNELYTTFEKSCRGVVLGLFTSALVQGILAIIFFLITGIPNAVLLGATTMIVAMIPLFGSTPLTVAAVVYLFATGKTLPGVIMAVGAVIIGLSDNVIRPLFMKGANEMHPLLALVSVFGAINLLGAPGIFLGPIIAAVFVAFLKIISQELSREKLTLTPQA